MDVHAPILFPNIIQYPPFTFKKKQVFTCDIFSASTPLGSRAHSIFCHCPRGSARRRGAGPGPFSGSVAVPLHPKNTIYLLFIYFYLFMFEPLRKIKKTTNQLQPFNNILYN
jgi:hypothetical protein